MTLSGLVGDGEKFRTRAGELELLWTADVEASSLSTTCGLPNADAGRDGDDVDFGEKNLSMVGVLATRLAMELGPGVEPEFGILNRFGVAPSPEMLCLRFRSPSGVPKIDQFVMSHDLQHFAVW